MTANREVVCTYQLSVLVHDVSRGHLAPVFRLDDNHLTESRGLIALHTIGDALDYILEDNLTRILGNDNGIEGVPLGNDLALLYRVALIDIQGRAIRHILGEQHDVGVHINETHLGQTAYHHLGGCTQLVYHIYRTQLLKLYA